MAPSANQSNGRDHRGRFTKGNPGGPGNPHVRRVGELRSAVLAAVTPAMVSRVLQMLYQRALAGDVLAARELLDRALGKPKVTLEQKQTLPSPGELRARLTSLVEANPALPDQLASLGRRHITATVLPVATESRSEAAEGRGREDGHPPPERLGRTRWAVRPATAL